MDEQTITVDDVEAISTIDLGPAPSGAEPAVVRDDGDDSSLVFVLQHECWIDGEKYDAGLYRVADPSDDLVRFVSHLHSAGVADVQEGLDLSDVQSQEDGEAAQVVAQGEPDPETGRFTGPWILGHDAQIEIEEAQRRVVTAETDEEREAAEADLVTLSAEIDARLKEASGE